MSVVSIATLKTKFQTGDFPSEQDFIDLIDTLNNLSADFTVSIAVTGNDAGSRILTATPSAGVVGDYTYVWALDHNNQAPSPGSTTVFANLNITSQVSNVCNVQNSDGTATSPAMGLVSCKATHTSSGIVRIFYILIIVNILAI